MTIPSKLCCIICKKETSNLGISTHYRITHLGDNTAQLAANASRKGIKSWNSGKSKVTDQRILEMSKAISKTLKGRPGKKHTAESKRKIASTNGRVKLLLAEDMHPILKSVEHLQPLEKLYGG